jgi:hypothetical protein
MRGDGGGGGGSNTYSPSDDEEASPLETCYTDLSIQPYRQHPISLQLDA